MFTSLPLSDLNADDFNHFIDSLLIELPTVYRITLPALRTEINKVFSKKYDSYFAERILFAYDCMIEKYNCKHVNDIDTKLIIENLCDVIPNMHLSQKQIIETMLDDLLYGSEISPCDKVYKHGLTMHCIHYNDLIDGVIECKCLLKSKSTILSVIYITYNFYDNTYDMKILQRSSISEPVQKGSNTFAFVAQNKWFEKEQWIFQIKRDCNVNLQYSCRYSFRISLDIFRFCVKSLLNEHNNMTFILCLPVKYYDVRIHVFIQTVLHLYNVYVPNEIISLIFYSYDTHYFINYAEPFVCGNLKIELEHFHDLRASLLRCGMYFWNEDQFVMDDAYLITNNNNMNPQQCNINGIGLILTFKDDTVTDTNYPQLFKILQNSNIVTPDLTGIWTVNKASELFAVQIIYSQIEDFITDNELQDKIEIDLQILVDKNIVEDSQFLMLWINWKRHLSQCEKSFDFYHRQNDESLSGKNTNIEEYYQTEDNCNWVYSPLLFECNLWKDAMPVSVTKNIKYIFKYNGKFFKKVIHDYRWKKQQSKKCQHKKRKFTKKSHKFMYHRW